MSFGEEPTEFVLHAELGRPPPEIGDVEKIALGNGDPDRIFVLAVRAAGLAPFKLAEDGVFRSDHGDDKHWQFHPAPPRELLDAERPIPADNDVDFVAAGSVYHVEDRAVLQASLASSAST